MIRELICINCPLGCPLVVEMEEETIISVKGNTCPRGDVYARKEVLHPKRIVTSSIPVKGGRQLRAGVKTNRDVDKDKVFDVMRALKGIEVTAPVRIGQIVVKNAANTGADLVISQNVPAK